VLLSGNHAAIDRWRRQQALGRTWLRRPDLLERLELTIEQRKLLDEFVAQQGEGTAGSKS
jgi:tRNA (guanine37-N1)-methyltransferase